MNKVQIIAGIALVLFLVTFGFWRGYQSASSTYELKLSAEKAAHEQTMVALKDALKKGTEWQAAFEDMRNTANSCRDTAEFCLKREQDCRHAFEEQEAVFKKSKVRPRTAQEQKNVVDDGTRGRAASVLNGDW